MERFLSPRFGGREAFPQAPLRVDLRGGGRGVGDRVRSGFFNLSDAMP